MKKLLTALAVVLSLGLATASMDAEAAKRMGGGKSFGTQREAVQNKAPSSPSSPSPQASPSAAPATAATPAAAVGTAAARKPSWAGPLAGLAAGLGLAALASHFGFGEQLASMMMMGLLAVAVMAVIGFVLRRRNQAAPGHARAAQGLTPAAIGPGTPYAPFPQATQPENTYKVAPSSSPLGTGSGSLIGSALQPQASQPSIPADFDRAGFEHHAKSNFVRLQAAYDSGQFDALREFTTPEMLAQLQQELGERGPNPQRGEVLQLEAQVLDVAQEPQRYLVSVRFTGFIRYGAGIDDEVFDEVWHLSKPLAGTGGWVLAGIQQPL